MAGKVALLAVLIMAAEACGPAGADSTGGSAAGFRALTVTPYEGEWAAGGLRIQVTNSLPKVEVPDGQIPTVSHINPKICSRPSADFQRMVVQQDGNARYESPKGVARCFELSPTTYADSTEDYILSPSQVTWLINQDYVELHLSMKESVQYTTYFYPCSPSSVGSIKPRPDAPNELRVTVHGHSLLHFCCR